MTDLSTKPDVILKIDAELLAEAQRQISAPSPDAAVEEALQRLVETERAKRQAALDALRKMVDSGEVTFLLPGEEEE